METGGEKLLYALFGWALGFLGTILFDAYKRFYDGREIRASLRTELTELRYRLAVVAMALDMRLGRLDRSLLVWIKPIYASYKGVNPSEFTLRTVESLLTATDEQIAVYAEAMKSPDDGALGLKKQAAPILESKFANLSSLSAPMQGRLMEVRAHLGILNEEIDQARFFFNMTFSSGVSEENYNRAVINLRNCYRLISERAKIVADHISVIDWGNH